MAAGSDREGHDDGPVDAEDAPPDGHGVRGEHDHHRAERDADEQREPEALHDLGPFEPEVGLLDLLLRCAPLNVV